MFDDFGILDMDWIDTALVQSKYYIWEETIPVDNSKYYISWFIIIKGYVVERIEMYLEIHV